MNPTKDNITKQLRSHGPAKLGTLRSAALKLRCSTSPALVTLGLLACSVSAQTWQTVDSFQYATGYRAVNSGLVVAPSGVIFACGYGSDGSTDHGLVMASADDGNTWSAPLDDFFDPAGTTQHLDIAADSAGNLYVTGRYSASGGFSTSSKGPYYRFVRRSADGGATWQTVDTVTAYRSTGGAIATDPAGNVYVTETVTYMNITNLPTWSIRKGTGGTNYFTVDVFEPTNSAAYTVFAHPTAGVFAAGYGTITSKNSSSQAWMIRRSLDSGATWQTVDTYQLRAGYSSIAYGLGADGIGNLYAVGESGYGADWIVRKSSDGGTTWNTVDAFSSTEGTYLRSSDSSYGVALTCDSNGNVFAAGFVVTFYGPHWVVRESPGGSGAWTTVNDIALSGSASPSVMAADRFGHAFVGGYDNGLWLIQRN